MPRKRTRAKNAPVITPEVAPVAKKRRYPVYMYPLRHPLYQRFVNKYAPVGMQAVLRKLAVEGFALARDEMDQYLANVSLLGEGSPFPLIEVNDSTERTAKPYMLYLRTEDLTHSRLLAYIDSLPERHRQRFMQLVFVRGMELPEIEEMLRGL